MKSHWCLGWVLAWTAAALAADPPRPTYRIETLAGSDRMGDGGLAVNAQFGTIQGIAGDRAGNLYIADLGNQRVRRVSPDGSISTVAGNGQKGSKGDDGPAADAQLMSPRNVAVDGSGNVYFSEFEGHRVRKVSPDGRISTFAGTGIAGFSGDGFTARAAQIGYPAALALDRAGALYFCDSQNHRVRKVIPGGIIVTVLGGAPGTTLLTPTSLALDPAGNIYVGDRSAIVRQFTPLGKWTSVAGTGEPGFDGDNGPASAAKLTSVRDLAVDGAGLLIADSARIRRVNSFGIITTLAGDGYLHAIGDGGLAVQSTLLRPAGLALDPSGNLFVADFGLHRVRRIVTSGQIVTVAGTGAAGFNLNQLIAASTPLDTPSGVAADSLGNVFIADSNNHRIRIVSNDGRIRTLAGTGVVGSDADGVTADRASLRAPRGVCLDRAGNSYAVDTGNHRLVRVPSSGLITTAAGNGAPGDGGDGGLAPFAQLNLPYACVTDGAGNLYIADTVNHRIRRVDPAGQITTVAGNGTDGFAGDDGPATAARLSSPRAVALDAEGSLYIADTGNHRIRKVSPDGVIRTVAGRGTPGFTGDGGPAASALLNGPSGIAVDAAGIVYIADTLNSRIRKLVLETLPPAPLETPPEITLVSGAGRAAASVAPGQVVTVNGVGLGPEYGVTASLDTLGLAETVVGGTEVRFDGVPAPVLYAQAGQVNTQVPYSVRAQAATTLEVLYRGASRGRITVAVADAAPVLFPGPQHADGSLNSQLNPAARGSVVTFYATGEGLTTGPNITGKPAAEPLPRPVLPLSLKIAGVQAGVLYAGAAPGLVGILQIDARVPAGFIPPGEAQVDLAIGPIHAPLASMWLK